jgi:hypothetical protein
VVLVSLFAGSSICQAGNLYQEDFEDGVPDGLVTCYGSWTIGSGLAGSAFGYHASGGYHDILAISGVPSSDVIVEVDFSIASAGWGDFDIWLNAGTGGDVPVDPWPGYRVMVNPQESDNPDAWIQRSDILPTHTITGLCMTPNTIQANERHTLRVHRDGSDILAYLDDALIMSASDGTYLDGGLALRLAGGGVIDNILVTTIPEPATLSLLALGGLAMVRRQRRA